MAFKAVKLRELQIDAPAVKAPEAEEAQRKDRYDLSTALGVVREMETSAGRAAVFEEIKRKNSIYRLVDAIYAAAGSRLFQPLALLLYMLKCVLSVGPFDSKDAQAVSIANFENEHKTIARISGLASDAALLHLTIARRHIFRVAQVWAAVRLIVAARRIWPFLQRLTRRYSFMPAARIASALAFYMRFSKLFDDRESLNAAIVASNYSPESVGLAAAAHKNSRHVIYSNHAPVPANGQVVPPVLSDCALFYGEMTTKTYQARSACTAEVAYIGEPGTAREMEWRDAINTVGIFLTSGTKIDVLRSLIATIRASLPSANVIVRQHPVTLLKTDFSDLAQDDAKVKLTIGNPLADEIAACDLVICGNSGVALNVVSAGRPVAYLSSLDGIIFDSNGFVASRLVYAMPWWSDDIYDRLKGFYQSPGWLAVMQSYDASYGADSQVLHKHAAEVLERYLQSPQNWSDDDATNRNWQMIRQELRKLAGDRN